MTQIFPHIIPKIEDWPVAKLSENRADFIKRLNTFVFDQLVMTHTQLYEVIAKTVYLESQRMKLNPWKVDPADERTYWKNMSVELEASTHREDKEDAQNLLLKRIINRYNEEIVGNFKPKTFSFSRIFLTSFFKRIFNRYFGKQQWRWGGKSKLQQNIKIVGDLDLIRNLFQKGTVVVLPTHYSNLDSIMVGYAIDANVGLPSFSYGAGLNLFNVEIMAYFMNRLGAFRVDRRKKNPIYLECLKSMTGFSLYEGVNCIFFPGGTRSRSGETEDKLKLGLISSVIEAQRLHIEKNSPQKIFVVPLNIGYHFVLEGAHLIDQHLLAEHREKYIRTRHSGLSIASVLKFIKDLYTKESEVIMSFGHPMDVLGNLVDADGNSFDKFGQNVDMKDYFTFEGQLSNNSQREGVYSKILAEAVTAAYKKYNVILSSNVVAFVAFHQIFMEFGEIGLLNLLNQKNQKYTIDFVAFNKNVQILVNYINEKATLKECLISDENWADFNMIVKDGLNKLGIYHAVNVLTLEKNGKLVCGDLKLLYFYHNRLANYEFETLMNWKKI